MRFIGNSIDCAGQIESTDKPIRTEEVEGRL